MKSANSCEHDNCYVIYTGTKCPLCDANEDLSDAKNQIADLENVNGELKDRAERAEQQVEENE